jgi:hypothetical protein
VVSGKVTQLMRCFSACTPVGALDAGNYVIAPADLGAILGVRETATNSGGTTVVWSSQCVGPISSISSGSAVLSATTVQLRNSRCRERRPLPSGKPARRTRRARA